MVARTDVVVVSADAGAKVSAGSDDDEQATPTTISMTTGNAALTVARLPLAMALNSISPPLHEVIPFNRS